MKPIKAWIVLIKDRRSGKEYPYRPNGLLFVGTEKEAQFNSKVAYGDCYHRAVSARPVRVMITVEAP